MEQRAEQLSPRLGWYEDLWDGCLLGVWVGEDKHLVSLNVGQVRCVFFSRQSGSLNCHGDKGREKVAGNPQGGKAAP